jgi:cystathionine gamma-synthase/methionine-gamma-lyase
MNKRSFQTRAVHAGERVKGADFTPVAAPIYPTVGYLYDSMDDTDAVLGGTRPGFVYTRYANPTTSAFEEAIANLENAEAAQAYGSGMAALHAAILGADAKAESTIVAALDLYGATFSLLRGLMSTLGMTIRLIDATDHHAVSDALTQTGSTLLLVETISNPLLKIADIPALAKIAHQHNAALLVDNTFASPYLYNPLKHGADYSIHSATKYIGGHGDVTAGVIATSFERKKKLFELGKMTGGILGPFEAWLALRGVKTLPLRMKAQCANAMQIAEWLTQHPRVAKVNYPGLESHKQHSLASQLFEGKGFGGMISFEIKDANKSAVFRFMEKLSLFLPATTLGDVYSLVLHPMTASHRSLTPEERAKVGIADGLVRISCGIESAEDLIGDLDQALGA